MAEPPPERRATIAPDDWIRAAERNPRDAEILSRSGGSPKGIYHLAGFAVECTLKGVIMQRRGWVEWPNRRREPRFYSHDLRRLLELAGLSATLEREVSLSPTLADSWRVVQAWRHDLRYPGLAMPSTAANDMLRHVNDPDDGVLSWLLKLYHRP